MRKNERITPASMRRHQAKIARVKPRRQRRKNFRRQELGIAIGAIARSRRIGLQPVVKRPV